MLILSEINDHKIQIKGVVIIPSAFNVLHFRLRVNDGVLFNCFSFYDPEGEVWKVLPVKYKCEMLQIMIRLRSLFSPNCPKLSCLSTNQSNKLEELIRLHQSDWLHRCWWRMLKTKYVGENFKMLVTVLAISVTNSLYLFT